MTEYWEPRSEADLEAAIQQQLLRESHVFDVKKHPPPAAKNRDIAIDLASFAVNGGKILFGISQSVSSGPTSLNPFSTAGLPERLDQIARGGAIDPPLRIRCVDIASDHQPGLGYLLVVIPPSPDAPHMVDGRYRYRSDRTNAVMSDAEVRRVADLRARRKADVAAILQAEVERDPTNSSLRTQGHLFIVAQPLLGAPDLLARAIRSRDWRSWLQGAFQQQVMSLVARVGAPDLFREAQTISSRLDGWAIGTYEMGEDRRLRPNGSLPIHEDSLLDLEIRDDGSLHLFCARASFDWPPRGPTIFHALVVGLTRRVVRAAIAVVAQTDYQGDWGFGLAIRGLGNASVDRGPISGMNPRRIGSYDETMTAAYEQLMAAPDQVVQQLLARFFRGLGHLDEVPGLEGLT